MTDLDRYLPLIASGDADAFGRWLAGAEERVRMSLRSYARAVDTEAVLQEALLRVWQVAPRVKPDGRPDALLRLAVRVARNLAVDQARRRRVTVRDAPALEALQHAAMATGEPSTPDPGLRQAIIECVDKLPSKPQQALTLRLAGARSDRAVAEACGLRVNTFLQNVTRARKLVADCLRRAGIDLAEVLS